MYVIFKIKKYKVLFFEMKGNVRVNRIVELGEGVFWERNRVDFGDNVEERWLWGRFGFWDIVISYSFLGVSFFLVKFRG